MYINNPGHMTKMAAMPIYGKNPSKFFFSGTTGLISTKLGKKHWGLEFYNVFINYDLWMTLTYFKARSTGRPCIRMREIVKMSFERQILQDMGRWTEGR